MGSVYLHELYFATLGDDGAAVFTGISSGLAGSTTVLLRNAICSRTMLGHVGCVPIDSPRE